MFTGLIRHQAKVISFNGEKLTLEATYNPKIGDSIAVNGACLTVIETNRSRFTVELSHESQKLLAVENIKSSVHIEPAMMMGDRFEGHIVQGHIDYVGKIERIETIDRFQDIYISVPKEALRLIAPKGSIAVDGVSLTVNSLYQNGFRLTLIPHSLKNTLFHHYRVARRVNIETDLFARYLAHMQSPQTVSWSEVDSIMASY